MAIAGHVSPKMLAHYSHVRLDAKRKALAALAEAGHVTRSTAEERARQIAYVAEQSAAAARAGAVEEYVENVTLDQIFGLMARKMARAILP